MKYLGLIFIFLAGCVAGFILCEALNNFLRNIVMM
jgi:hypothetical protein